MMEEHVLDLIPGYALGILDADDEAQVSKHLLAMAVALSFP